MQTKLTLRMDSSVIEGAKRWARSRDVSLSQVVSDFLAQLPQRTESAVLSPWTRRLVGAARGSRLQDLGDDALRHEYLSYLDAKYR